MGKWQVVIETEVASWKPGRCLFFVVVVVFALWKRWGGGGGRGGDSGIYDLLPVRIHSLQRNIFKSNRAEVMVVAVIDECHIWILIGKCVRMPPPLMLKS